jgi:hypothetical protein
MRSVIRPARRSWRDGCPVRTNGTLTMRLISRKLWRAFKELDAFGDSTGAAELA